MLAGVSSEADKCRMMPDGTFTQIDDKPAASAALSPHGSAPMRACRGVRGSCRCWKDALFGWLLV